MPDECLSRWQYRNVSPNVCCSEGLTASAQHVPDSSLLCNHLHIAKWCRITTGPEKYIGPWAQLSQLWNAPEVCQRPLLGQRIRAIYFTSLISDHFGEPLFCFNLLCKCDGAFSSLFWWGKSWHPTSIFTETNSPSKTSVESWLQGHFVSVQTEYKLKTGLRPT